MTVGNYFSFLIVTLLINDIHGKRLTNQERKSRRVPVPNYVQDKSTLEENHASLKHNTDEHDPMQNNVLLTDIHRKIEEIMKYVQEEKHVTLQPVQKKYDSMHNTAKTLPRHHWLARQVLADLKKLNLIRHVLRKEQRRLSVEYADTKKKRMFYARKMMSKGGRTYVASNGLICENPSHPLHQYDCVYGNKSLHIDGTDALDVSLQLEQTNAVFNEGNLLFEFGLVYEKDGNQRKQIPGITGYHCQRKHGLCIELFGRETIELLENEEDSKLVEHHFRFKLHQRNVILIKEGKLQSIFKIESDEENVFLYPACRVYNPHLAKISLSINTNTGIGFNISSIDNHMFVSDDNKTISNWPIRFHAKWFNINEASVLVIILLLALFISIVEDIALRRRGERCKLTTVALILKLSIFEICLLQYLHVNFYSMLGKWVWGMGTIGMEDRKYGF